MRLQFRVKTQSGIDALLFDNDTADNCHYSGPSDFHAMIRRSLADTLCAGGYPLEDGDTIHVVKIGD